MIIAFAARCLKFTTMQSRAKQLTAPQSTRESGQLSRQQCTGRLLHRQRRARASPCPSKKIGTKTGQEQSANSVLPNQDTTYTQTQTQFAPVVSLPQLPQCGPPSLPRPRPSRRAPTPDEHVVVALHIRAHSKTRPTHFVSHGTYTGTGVGSSSS
jgi:hypothetical protein